MSLRKFSPRTSALRTPSLRALSVGALSLCSARMGYCGGIAALLVFFGCESLQNATAEGETRTISFHHMHTNEDLTVTYKVNGRYDEAALQKINHELRDWREDKTIQMDPHVIDLLWEVQRETGSKGPIWVVCGYRSPGTNEMLRHRSSGVAKFSQHTLGKAVDFYIPGVPLDQLRAAGLRAQRGGVGFYPTSGSPFVHLDTGSVRHWPRMPEAQLAAVLSKGPLASQSASDGRGIAVAQAGFKPSGLLAKLFGGGKDEEQDAETAAQPAPSKVRTAAAAKPVAIPTPPVKPVKPASKPATYQVASADSRPASLGVASLGVGSASIQPAFELASTTSKPVILASDDTPAAARPAQASSMVSRSTMSANDIINERGYWQGLPSGESTDTPPAAAAPAATASRPAPAAPAPRRPAATASAEPASTASVAPWPFTNRGDSEPLPNALAYAAQPTPIAAARAVPMSPGMGAGAARAAQTEAKRGEDRVAAAPAPATAAPKIKGTTVVRVGDRFNDPWMRAMIVSPSAQSFMRTTVYGVQDFRTLGPFLMKPATTVAMTFTNDPHSGMTSERFAGTAVAFTPTVTFGSPRTASAQK